LSVGTAGEEGFATVSAVLVSDVQEHSSGIPINKQKKKAVYLAVIDFSFIFVNGVYSSQALTESKKGSNRVRTFFIIKPIKPKLQ